MDSFNIEFKDDGKIEDLSDVTADGYRTYEDKNLKWSIDGLAYWEKYQDADKENEIIFSGKNSDNQEFDFINIKMFSKEDGLTLDKWIDNEVKFVKANYNSELVKILKIEDTKINNIPAKKLYMSFKKNNSMEYGCSMYLVGENYRYELEYAMSANTYNSEEKSKIEKSINSFKFTEPDVSKIGQFVDTNSIFNDTIRTIKNKQYKYSFEIPSDWIQSSENKDSQSVSYYNQKKQIQFDMGVGKNIDMDEFLDYYDNTMLKQAEIMGKLKETKNETLNEKGTTVKKYINTLVIDDYTIKEVYYVLNKNGNLYTIVFDIRDITSSETNMKLIDSIWKSMKFE